MVKFCFLILTVFTFGCGAHQEGIVAARAAQPAVGSDNNLANLERAARYPWMDGGRCAVQESSGDWATLVERCYGVLDLHRIRFVDHKRACPIAQAGVMSADRLTQLVGICLLVQPEVAVGAVIVIGAVVVAAAIVTEIEAARRTRKPGCRCLCIKAGVGPDSKFGRVQSPAQCTALCKAEGYSYSECK